MTAAAVLSLNGKAQVTLRAAADDRQTFVEEQHTIKHANGSSSAPVALGAATQQVMQVLGSLARVKISDGRIVLGRIHCFDKHQNVILTEAREFPPLSSGEKPKPSKHSSSSSNSASGTPGDDDDAAFEKHRTTATSRSLGMTLVPGKHIVYIKVHQ